MEKGDLEMENFPKDQDILAGIFSYVDNGENVERKFFVRTCVNQDVSLDGGEHQSTRESDLNLQLENAWALLLRQGYKRIKFASINPNPFF